MIELAPEERFRLAAFLRHLVEQDDPDYQRALDEADARISPGQRITLEELRKLVAATDSSKVRVVDIQTF